MISKQEISRMILAGSNASYNDTAKQEYKRLSLKLLRTVAKELGCYGPGIVRFNPGGIAVSGDAILHSDRVYIMVSSFSFSLGILVRAVSGRKDYTGKANHYYSISNLETYGAHGLTGYAKNVAEFHVSLDYAIPGHCKACTRPIMREHLNG